MDSTQRQWVCVPRVAGPAPGSSNGLARSAPDSAGWHHKLRRGFSFLLFGEGGRQAGLPGLAGGFADSPGGAFSGGVLHVASSSGLRKLAGTTWQPVEIKDGRGRAWGVGDVLGVAFDSKGRLWFAAKAGVGCETPDGWRFYEGKDGLPWNDFTGIAAGPGGEVWFTTHLGVIRFDGEDWQYRQGPALAAE